MDDTDAAFPTEAELNSIVFSTHYDLAKANLQMRDTAYIIPVQMISYEIQPGSEVFKTARVCRKNDKDVRRKRKVKIDTDAANVTNASNVPYGSNVMNLSNKTTVSNVTNVASVPTPKAKSSVVKQGIRNTLIVAIKEEPVEIEHIPPDVHLERSKNMQTSSAKMTVKQEPIDTECITSNASINIKRKSRECASDTQTIISDIEVVIKNVKKERVEKEPKKQCFSICQTSIVEQTVPTFKTSFSSVIKQGRLCNPVTVAIKQEPIEIETSATDASSIGEHECLERSANKEASSVKVKQEPIEESSTFVPLVSKKKSRRKFCKPLLAFDNRVAIKQEPVETVFDTLSIGEHACFERPINKEASSVKVTLEPIEMDSSTSASLVNKKKSLGSSSNTSLAVNSRVAIKKEPIEEECGTSSDVSYIYVEEEWPNDKSNTTPSSLFDIRIEKLDAELLNICRSSATVENQCDETATDDRLLRSTKPSNIQNNSNSMKQPVQTDCSKKCNYINQSECVADGKINIPFTSHSKHSENNEKSGCLFECINTNVTSKQCKLAASGNAIVKLREVENQNGDHIVERSKRRRKSKVAQRFFTDNCRTSGKKRNFKQATNIAITPHSKHSVNNKKSECIVDCVNTNVTSQQCELTAGGDNTAIVTLPKDVKNQNDCVVERSKRRKKSKAARRLFKDNCRTAGKKRKLKQTTFLDTNITKITKISKDVYAEPINDYESLVPFDLVPDDTIHCEVSNAMIHQDVAESCIFDTMPHKDETVPSESPPKSRPWELALRLTHAIPYWDHAYCKSSVRSWKKFDSYGVKSPITDQFGSPAKKCHKTLKPYFCLICHQTFYFSNKKLFTKQHKHNDVVNLEKLDDVFPESDLNSKGKIINVKTNELERTMMPYHQSDLETSDVLREMRSNYVDESVSPLKCSVCGVRFNNVRIRQIHELCHEKTTVVKDKNVALFDSNLRMKVYKF